MCSTKRSHEQCFKEDYEKLWPVLKRSNKSQHHVFCTMCCADFSIAHGGKNDCRRHVEGLRHIENAKIKSSNKQLPFVLPPPENLNVIRAEALFTKFLIEHNCPLALADHAGFLFKKMFPDSEIAKKYACGRTKATAIVKSFASTSQERITALLQENKFTLATDGSNSVTDKKLFPIVVTYYDKQMGKITTSLLALPCLENDSTGQNIFNLLDSELTKKKLTWNNCVAFCSDNASVMTGQRKGVSSFIKLANPKIIMHGCTCHLIHLTAQHAFKELNVFNIEEFLVDVYFYLKKSTKRLKLLSFCQEVCGLEERKITKYGSTRWLSMENVINRFLDQWDALLKFFCEEENGCTSAFCRIKQRLEMPTTKLYLLFLQSVLPVFSKANCMMQNDAPLTHVFLREITSLFTELLARYIKPTVFSGAETVFSVDFDAEKNQKSDQDLVIGSKTRQYLKDANLSNDSKSKFFNNVRRYFSKACKYMIKKFPLQDELYKHAEISDIKLRQHKKLSSLHFFLDLFDFDYNKRDIVESEFAAYQIDVLSTEIVSCDRPDTAWSLIQQLKDYNGCQKFPLLPELMLNILLIPHSNASCERVFSIINNNLTEYRCNLSHSTLEALVIEKCLTRSDENVCYKTVFTDEQLKKAKSATSLHFLPFSN